MTARPRVRVLALVFVLAGLPGCGSAIIGGECEPGLRACDGQCVDTETDLRHCGGCGVMCSVGGLCAAGRCVGGGDGSVPDASMDAPATDAPGRDAPADGPARDGRAMDGPAGDVSVPPDGSGTDAARDGGGRPDGGAGDGGARDGGARDGGAPDAGPSDAGTGDGGPGRDAGPGADGGVRDGGPPGDGGARDGGVPGCDLGEILCGDVCVRPLTDVLHCGGCDEACGFREICALGVCARACGAPLRRCSGSCVDLNTNPAHCGGCGNVCSTGICNRGVCQAPVPGHVVVIGHDYRFSHPDMNRIAGNAVFLPGDFPVKVIVYQGTSLPASVQGVTAAIDEVAMLTGRTWNPVPVSRAVDVPVFLEGADAFLVHAQHGSTDTTLRAVGDLWATALRTFLRRGGVIVVFEGLGAHRGTYQILEAAGLFSARGRFDVSGSRVSVLRPSDPIASGLPLQYTGEPTTVRFDMADPTAVIGHPAGAVVVHRVIPP